MVVGSQRVGGWVSGLNKQRDKMGGLRSNNQSLFTLFVDNLPEEVNQNWLRSIFTNYGVVKDVFIPNKRSKRTGSKFGFVRYDCSVSAGVAISKANGLWVSDKKFFVKQASFDQCKNNTVSNIPFFQQPNVVTNSKVNIRNQGVNTVKNGQMSYLHGKSFAQMVSGESNKQMVSGESNKSGSDGKETDKNLSCCDKGCRRVSLKPSGNGWLYRSAVAKLHKLISIIDLKGQLKGMGLDNVEIKALGGRSVILTCPNSDELENMIKERCLQRWFSEISPWDGQAACPERFVWICCYGFPLNVWSNNSFKSIGELWGTFLSTDESTLKMSSFAEAKILIATNIFKEIDEWIIVEVEGKSYKVKVMEDSCVQPHEAENQIPRVGFDSSHLSDKESMATVEEKEDEDSSEPGSENVGISPDVVMFVRQGSGNEDLGDAAKDGNIENQSKDINFTPTLDLDSIVEDSMGLQSLFQEVEDTGVKYQGDKILSHVIPMVTDPMKPSNEVMEPWNEYVVFDSENNIRASQIEGINLMVDFRPGHLNGKNSGQVFGEDMVSIDSRGTSVPSYDLSGCIADTPDQEQCRIEKELQETIIAGTKLGIKYDDAGILRMKKIIEQEDKDLKNRMRNNPFAPLQRNKHQRKESQIRQSSSIVF